MGILITGGAGFIGSHTSVELLNAGFEIIILDNFSNSKEITMQRIEELTGKKFIYYRMDLLDKENIESIFLKHKIDTVIHFAGLKSVGESVSIPLKYYNNNIIGTINLLEAMKRNGVKNLVFSSSATVYGIPKMVPIKEDFPLSPTNPYGRTKAMIEEVLRDLYKSDPEWSIAILRYFNPIGAHISGHLGEEPNGIPNNLMPYITQVAIGKLDKLGIFGKDYSTVDGTGVRDYIHVVDLAKGHLSAVNKVRHSNGVEAYNLGTGEGYSVLQIVSAFENESRVKIPYRIINRRPGDVAICFADVSKAKKELSWEAEKGIEEMCRDSWRWQRMNPNGYEEKVPNKIYRI